MPSVDMSANRRPASLHIGKWSIGMPTRRSGSSTPSAASAACASGHMARLVPATGSSARCSCSVTSKRSGSSRAASASPAMPPPTMLMVSMREGYYICSDHATTRVVHSLRRRLDSPIWPTDARPSPMRRSRSWPTTASRGSRTGRSTARHPCRPAPRRTTSAPVPRSSAPSSTGSNSATSRCGRRAAAAPRPPPPMSSPSSSPATSVRSRALTPTSPARASASASTDPTTSPRGTRASSRWPSTPSPRWASTTPPRRARWVADYGDGVLLHQVTARRDERPRRHRDRGRHPSPARLSADYSHSMVPGGFDVTSSTTRLTSRTSFVMRFEILASTS